MTTRRLLGLIAFAPLRAFDGGLHLEALAALHHDLAAADGCSGWRCGACGSGCKACRHDATVFLQKSLERRETVGGIEGEHLEDESVDLRRDVWPQLAWRNGSALEALADHRGRVVALERSDAGERMVDRSAERIHVGAVVYGLLLDLLWGDVVGRTPDLVSILLHRRKAEVYKLRVAVRVKKHVLRLYVAMHKPLIGGAAERLRDLLADFHHPRNVD